MSFPSIPNISLSVKLSVPLFSLFVVNAQAAVPADPNTFLTLLERAVVEDDNSANAYYLAVDPNSKKTTYPDWLLETGFIDNLANYSASGDFTENFDAKVLYRNRTDLGFVRLVKARCEPSCSDPNPNLYAIIENYQDFDNALARTNRLASVAMEWTSAADGSNPSEKFVSFYAYIGSNDQRNEQAGIPFKPDLDTRGKKHIPGLCNSCHGGAPKVLNADGTYQAAGNTGGLFLPSDLNNYDFDPRPGLSKAEQQAQFKKMNEIALITLRGKKKFDEEAEINRFPAAHELVEGWYGGPGMPNPIFNGDFVPAGWLPPAAPANASELYLESVAPACRACHVQQERSLDFGTYKGFMVFEDAHKELVLRVECGVDDDSSVRGNGQDDQAVMPLAKKTYEIFWSSNEVNVFKEHVGEVECEN